MALSLHSDSSASKANRFEIVVAHFNEDLDWLKPAASEAIIYAKGKPPKEGHLFRETIKLPNIGRESHTFLQHIVYRYDTLADVTLFLQGSKDGPASLQAHTTLTVTQMIEKALETKVGKLTTFGSQEEGNPRPFWRWETSEWKADPIWKFWLKHQKGEVLDVDCSPGQFWFDTFGYNHPLYVIYAEGALFAVHAKSIHARPREFYQRLLNKFLATNHVNPEIGHFVERFWGEILSCVVGEELSSAQAPETGCYSSGLTTNNTGRAIAPGSSDPFAGIGSQFDNMLVLSKMPGGEGGEHNHGISDRTSE